MSQPLSFLHRPAAHDVSQPWLLVLLHGVGSNEQDLFGLAPYVPPAFHVVSLRAPYVMGAGQFAWFQFSVLPDGRRQIDTAQEAHSRALVAQAVEHWAQQLDVPPQRVVVGGFSQGGIMSLSLLLTQPGCLTAAMVLHSRLLPEVLPLAAPPEALKGKSLWVSHGVQDQVIPLAQAHATRAHCSALPVELTYREFAGAHSIAGDELAQAMQWLDGLRPPQGG
jgi:phospholipase/carboxylesterase